MSALSSSSKQLDQSLDRIADATRLTGSIHETTGIYFNYHPERDDDRVEKCYEGFEGTGRYFPRVEGSLIYSMNVTFPKVQTPHGGGLIL